MANIIIDPLDLNSIDKAIKELERIEKNLDEGCKKLVELLAQDGVRVAKAGFDTAVYAGEKGDIDVDSEIVKLRDGNYKAIVYAKGENVGFIEFGTGIRFPMGDTSNYVTSIPPHGTFDKKQGANPYGWWYYGYPTDNMPEGTDIAIRKNKNGEIIYRDGVMHTYGNPPHSCMHNAYEEIKRQINQRIKEAFRL